MTGVVLARGRSRGGWVMLFHDQSMGSAWLIRERGWCNPVRSGAQYPPLQYPFVKPRPHDQLPRMLHARPAPLPLTRPELRLCCPCAAPAPRIGMGRAVSRTHPAQGPSQVPHAHVHAPACACLHCPHSVLRGHRLHGRAPLGHLPTLNQPGHALTPAPPVCAPLHPLCVCAPRTRPPPLPPLPPGAGLEQRVRGHGVERGGAAAAGEGCEGISMPVCLGGHHPPFAACLTCCPLCHPGSDRRWVRPPGVHPVRQGDRGGAVHGVRGDGMQQDVWAGQRAAAGAAPYRRTVHAAGACRVL